MRNRDAFAPEDSGGGEPEPAAGPRSLRTLLVQERPEDCERLVAGLAQLGYRVTHDRVQTPVAMTAALENSVWDVVIADWALASFGAMQALVIMKKRGLELPFFVLSESEEGGLKEAALMAGANGFIRKAEVDDLVRAIRGVLGSGN